MIRNAFTNHMTHKTLKSINKYRSYGRKGIILNIGNLDIGRIYKNHCWFANTIVGKPTSRPPCNLWVAKTDEKPNYA